MWSVAAQHKKYNDALTGYNSLRDPHLHSYFRKPQIRRHLLRSNIINKDNKIVDEISSTKHVQNLERKQKRELYHLLEEMVKSNGQSDTEHADQNSDKALPIKTQEELIQQAKIMFDATNKEHQFAWPKNQSLPVANERNSILHRLDRMIRTIKENEHIHSVVHETKQDMKILPDSKLWLSKSYQDISDNRDLSQSPGQPIKSYSSSSQLPKEVRPKSSYGRQRSFLNASHLDLTQDSENEPVETMPKSKSDGNIATNWRDGSKDSLAYDEDIESLDGGDSWGDSDHENGGTRYHRLHHYSPSRFQSKSSKENATKLSYTLDNKKFAKSVNSPQRVQMTIKYNGLNGATNRGVQRSVKVLQQVAMGGNSILIYDGYVVPGGVFTFQIRPHLSNSFAMTILINGIRDLRLNTCCEHKHRPGTKLSHFTFVDVVGGRPCFACQLALDTGKTGANHHQDSNKYLDWFSAQTFDTNELTEPVTVGDKEIPNELDHNAELDSVESVEESALFTQQSHFVTQEKMNGEATLPQTVLDKDEEKRPPSAAKGFKIVDSTGDRDLEGHTELETNEQTHQVSQQDLPVATSPAKDLLGGEVTTTEEFDELDLRVIDYIGEETLPTMGNIDFDSDS